MQKVKVKDIGGDVVKDNSTYKIQDNKLLKRKRKRNALIFILYINVFLIFLTCNSFVAHILDLIISVPKFNYPISM